MHNLRLLRISTAAAALALASQVAQADVASRTESGSFATDNAVQSFDFDVLAASDLRLWTTSYAAGMADPVLALFDRQSGALLSLSDDMDAPYALVDPSQGLLDAGILARDLAAGHYRVAVSLSPNFPMGGTWLDGYAGDALPGQPLDSAWTVRLELTNTAPVPEPEPGTLLLAGIAALGLLVQRHKSRKDREESSHALGGSRNG